MIILSVCIVGLIMFTLGLTMGYSLASLEQQKIENARLRLSKHE